VLGNGFRGLSHRPCFGGGEYSAYLMLCMRRERPSSPAAMDPGWPGGIAVR